MKYVKSLQISTVKYQLALKIFSKSTTKIKEDKEAYLQERFY